MTTSQASDTPHAPDDAVPVPVPRVCVLIPCYREAAHIGPVVQGALRAGHDVVVVDDGSPDDTAEVAERAGARVLRHETNRGKGAAMVTGYEHVLRQGYDAVVVLDGDGQHDPAEIPRFVECLRSEGARVVVGSRMDDTRGMPWIRKLTNRTMSALLSWQMGQRVPDTQCGYRLWHRDALPLLLARRASTGFAAESESLLLAALHGHRIASVPISTIYGDEKSKIRPWRDTRLFVAMLLRFRREREALLALVPRDPAGGEPARVSGPCVTFEDAAADDLADVADLARRIWPQTYANIIPEEQIRFMLAEQYAPDRLRADAASGVTFVYAAIGSRRVGYFAYGPSEAPKEALLHKVYLLPEWQGRGAGSAMLREAQRRCRESGYDTVLLYVNQRNARAIRAYQRNGFRIRREVRTEIGHGFVKLDYLMEAPLFGVEPKGGIAQTGPHAAHGSQDRPS